MPYSKISVKQYELFFGSVACRVAGRCDDDEWGALELPAVRISDHFIRNTLLDPQVWGELYRWV